MVKIKKDKKVEERQQLRTVTGKFNRPLFEKMQEWLNQNGISANQLLAKAVEKYISEPQTLEPVEVVHPTRKKLDAVSDKMMADHKKAMDDLK